MAAKRKIPKLIKTSAIRDDALPKCRGRAGYLDEMRFPDALHVKTVRSKQARARLVSVTPPKLPKGYVWVDKTDVPGKLYPRLIAEDYPVLADGRVNYVGEAIALIAGPCREEVFRLCEEVEIQYEDLPPVLSLEDSLSPDAPRISGTDNIYAALDFERGAVDPAMAAADLVLEDEYHTGYQEHLYLETLRMTAVFEGEELVFYGPSQGPDPMPRFLAQVFGVAPERFRAVCTTVGGGFGGKIESPIIMAAHVGLAAWKAGKPAVMTYDRREDILVSTKRHPGRVKIRAGVNRDGRIQAMDMTVQLLAGAYTWFCPVTLDVSVKMACSTYDIPNLRVNGSAHACNQVMPGAMRGFGVVQTVFALETHLERMAARLGMDPLDFKALNGLRKGSLTSTGGVVKEEIHLPRIISRLREISGYDEKRAAYAGQTGRYRNGIGTALYAFGAPHTMGQGPRRMPRPLSICRRDDGHVEIRTNIVEIGQGITTVFKKIAAAVLEIPMDRISMPRPDSKKNPHTLGTGASLSVVLFGKSLERAAQRLKERWDTPGVIEEIEDFTEPETLVWDEEKLSGDSFHTYSWGGMAVEVEADTVTGEVSVLGAWSCHDIGTVMDPLIAKGQVDGALVMGLGMGLWENLTTTNGRPMQTGLADYIIPTAVDLPALENEFMDSYYEHGPFGAKSLGEMPIVGGPAAVAAALAQALSVTVKQAPATPEYLVGLMNGDEREEKQGERP